MAQARQLVHEDPRAAEGLTRRGQAAAVEQQLPEIAAQAQYLLAQIVTERGGFEEGLALIADARTSWLAAHQPTAALRTDLGRMQILDDLGRHTDAVAVGKDLVSAVEAVGPDDPEFSLARAIRAHAIDNLGTAYGLLGQHEVALQAYAEAEADYRTLGMHAEAARPLANRGVELLALGRAREARVDLAAAVAGFRDSGDEVFAAKCAGYLAQAHQQLGEFFEALAVLTRARSTLEDLGASSEAVRLQLAIAETYLAIGGWPEARHEATEAADTTTTAGMLHDAATAHYLLASAELGAGDLDGADAALALAATQFDQVQDRQYGSRTTLLQAEVAAARGQLGAAARLAEQARSELAAGGWLVPLAGAHLRLADLATEPDEAARHLSAAAELVGQLGLPQLGYQYHLRAGRRAHARGAFDDAERLLRLATAELDRSARGLSDHALRTAFRAERLAAYDELVAVLLDRDQPGDDALARVASGAAKAATLRDLVTSSVGVGPQLSGQGSELADAYADLGATYQALQAVEDAEHRLALTARADGLEQRVSALRLRQPTLVRAAGPDPTAGVALPSDAVTCEFHVSGDDLAVFVTGRDELAVHRQRGVVPRIAELLDELGDQWARFQLGSVFSGRHQEVLLRTTREVLSELYEYLLGPVAAYLRGTPPAELRIVPHGLLGQVPFAALYDGRQHLVQGWPLTVCPTPSAPRPAPVARGDALVIGVADETAPAAEAEARAVAALLPGARLLAGPAATAAAFLAEAPRHRLLHLACHGVFREANPLFSRLRLADRWVTCAEIVQLDLAGAYVVLSACESGQHRRAAEPVGLGWAFLAAGAAGVIVSHCVVDDASTERLMRSFHGALAAGQQPAYALRTAQLQVAETSPHPFYWSPFSYVARPGPTARSTP